MVTVAQRPPKLFYQQADSLTGLASRSLRARTTSVRGRPRDITPRLVVDRHLPPDGLELDTWAQQPSTSKLHYSSLSSVTYVPIYYTRINSGIWYHEERINILEAACTLKALDSTGEVTSGFINLSGSLVTATLDAVKTIRFPKLNPCVTARRAIPSSSSGNQTRKKVRTSHQETSPTSYLCSHTIRKAQMERWAATQERLF